MKLPSKGLFARIGSLVEANHGTLRGFIRTVLAHCEDVLGTADRFMSCDLAGTRRLVFVCHGNINRSAFAHAVAATAQVRVASVGFSTSTGAAAPDRTVVAARRLGIDLSRHQATAFDDFQRVDGDLFIAVELRHARRLQALGIPPSQVLLLGALSSPRRLHLHDPHTLADEYLLTCLVLIHSAVLNLVAELRRAHSLALEALA
jgi:protein-tyrosine phosphatase